jgi:N,N-dimethylformamidase
VIGGPGPRSRPDDHGNFDGVVAEPCLVGRELSAGELGRIRAGARPAAVAGPALLAGWTFPAAQAPVASGPAAGGTVALRNTPAVAMPGPHGGNHALHCHSDDLVDAGWPLGASLALPAGTPSGVYAVRLRSDAGRDRVPFVVRPSTPGHGRVLLLLPTMTYLAYANERLPAAGGYLEHLAGSVRPGPLDRWLARHPEYGHSLYDRHRDGSGVSYSSLRRPIPNIRPDYLHWVSGEPRHLGADLFIVDWLERAGLAYDVACDHDLDEDGFALLEPYQVVLTGSHPEYCSETMLDALERHLDRDGRLMYLGGNGFYWVTSTSPREPATIEVRRGPKGFPWRSGEGESTHGFDGAEGGFWADRGRPARQLVGVTFVAMGAERPAPGYRLVDGLPPEDRWIVEGIETAEIGTRGRLMGGAAGHEIDCVDVGDGHPPGVTVVASSGGHADTLQIAAERRANAPDVDTLVPHADLVLYRRPGGGLVFSTGSICWCGSLADPGGDPGVQRLTENVLRRFLQPPRPKG